MLDRLRATFVLLLFVPLLAWTAEIEVVAPQLTLGDEGYVLSADFRFELNPRLEEAVSRGVVLYFVTEFELTRDRWYWLDEKVASRTQTHRLSYHALTRQYRLSTGGLHQSFDSLAAALQVLARVRNWLVIDKPDKSDKSDKAGRTIAPGEGYNAAVRLYLDISQLPRPFQISALGNKEWTLASDWKRWPASQLPPASSGEAK
ncbi:MAG: DUF4390 domain-containing protein [Dechloromonas sp.]|nr:DUF4390 domain-containing protein [Dechloromonas sp.]